jgi:hypothetical protein
MKRARSTGGSPSYLLVATCTQVGDTPPQPRPVIAQLSCRGPHVASGSSDGRVHDELSPVALPPAYCKALTQLHGQDLSRW